MCRTPGMFLLKNSRKHWSIKVKSVSVMMQALKERIASLETTNEDLCRELHQYRSRYAGVEHSEKDFKDIQAVMIKLIPSFYNMCIYSLLNCLVAG